MDVAIGIDVGYSARRSSAAAVIIERTTRSFPPETEPIFGAGLSVIERLLAELDRLRPTSTVFAIDGPLACAQAPSKVREVERFFQSGPFAAIPSGDRPRLRLMPAPTATGSAFLESTRTFVDALRTDGQIEMGITDSGITGNIIEIFPTLFMATMLRPHLYAGTRSAHSDDLWLKLIGRSSGRKLEPYTNLISRVESSARGVHDLRAAAISAIAADWFAASPPGSHQTAATMFIGTAEEKGFLLPSREKLDRDFLEMLEEHWYRAAGAALVWL